MRRVLATDFGIWPMTMNQERPTQLMADSADYWTRLADYLLLYDQVVIPTANLQVLAALRFMLGDDIVCELIEQDVIVFARYDSWFGYVGDSGIALFKADNGTTDQFPNLAISNFKPLDKAVDVAFKTCLLSCNAEMFRRFKNAILDRTIELPTEQTLLDAREEAYRDIKESPYLRDILSIRRAGSSIRNLPGSQAGLVHIYNPHVPAENNSAHEIRAVLRVAFENFLLGIGKYVDSTEITGDAASLSVLNAKGQRLGYSPYGRKAFASIQKVEGVPDISLAFSRRQLSATQIIDLRESKYAGAFRNWLSLGSPTDTADETIRRYVEAVSVPSVVDTLPVRLLRFGVTTAWGAMEPISGALLAAADSFVLSKLFCGRSPRLFLRQAKVMLANSPVITPPGMKGAQRNDKCPCGSGKKYKRCHGRS